jgi:hypothetical protein
MIVTEMIDTNGVTATVTHHPVATVPGRLIVAIMIGMMTDAMTIDGHARQRPGVMMTGGDMTTGVTVGGKTDAIQMIVETVTEAGIVVVGRLLQPYLLPL